LLQQFHREAMRLVGHAGQTNALVAQRRKPGFHIGIQMRMATVDLGVLVLIERQRFVEARLGVFLRKTRGEHALDQMFRTLADIAHHFFARGFLGVELGEHAVQAGGEVVGGIDHGAVEVDQRRFDARRRELDGAAHCAPAPLTVASCARIWSITAL
jgi:hypothetical protein